MAKHPIWTLYNEWRTARMNLKYYSCQLANARRLNFIIELVLAVSASTAIGGLWFFETAWGGSAWKWIGAVAAILSVVQVVAKPANRIQALEKRASGFRALEFDLSRLAQRVEHRARYDDELRAQFEAILDRKREIVLSYEDPTTSKRLLTRCMKEVNAELPVDSFFVPEKENHIHELQRATPDQPGTASASS